MVKIKENKGITILTLVITILILLILTGVTVSALTGENGIIKNARQSKEESEISEEKEILKQAVVKSIAKDAAGSIKKENLDEELDKTPGAENYESDEVEEGITVTYTKSNRSYLVDDEGNVKAYITREPEPVPPDSEIASFEMRYGVIEIEFLKGKSYDKGEANKPILKNGMRSVYWTDLTGKINLSNPQSNTVEKNSSSANFNILNWYEYKAQESGKDGKTSRWANATTSDGSYYVWIPRYAYRIVYFDTKEHENEYREGTLSEEEALAKGWIAGYSDARGIVDAEGKRPTEISSTTSISVNEKYFRTHPAFDGNPDEGGWDSKLDGFWVMKYEASRENATPTDIGNGTIPKSVPNVKTWGSAQVSEMFTKSRYAYSQNGQDNITVNSHMMKNSEWGAVAYLTESKYGRNGTEVSVNQCSSGITGTGIGIGGNTIYNSSYEWSEITEEQKYSGEIGQLSSTTGNIYGIYDMSGGAYEYVMGFYEDGNGNIYIGSSALKNSGFNGLLGDGSKVENGVEFPKTEKKYYQIYKDMDSIVLGDAIKETKNWNDDDCESITSTNPVINRSAYYKGENNAGIYYLGAYNGLAENGGGCFRICLAIK